ncbi:MAG: hypothetical protein OXN84_00320 [Albidovulum sp.]|nr:hypothetical protein [Albidovulum sp.]
MSHYYVALPEIRPWLMELDERCGEPIPQALICSRHPELINFFGAACTLALISVGRNSFYIALFGPSLLARSAARDAVPSLAYPNQTTSFPGGRSCLRCGWPPVAATRFMVRPRFSGPLKRRSVAKSESTAISMSVKKELATRATFLAWECLFLIALADLRRWEIDPWLCAGAGPVAAARIHLEGRLAFGLANFAMPPSSAGPIGILLSGLFIPAIETAILQAARNIDDSASVAGQ